MATFSSFPFTGGVVSTNPRDFGWIEISPTKIAVLYTANFNGTTRQVFAQMVTFSGSTAPVFGTPCALGMVTSLTINAFLRGAYLRDNLLIVAIPVNGVNNAQPTSFTFNVVQFDDQDRFQLLSTSAQQTGAVTNWVMPELVGYNGRVFSARRPTDSTHIIQEITVDGSNTIGLTLLSTTNYTTTGVQQYSQYARRAGKFWFFQCNAHATANQCNTAEVINLETATVTVVPASSMLQPSSGQQAGQGRTTFPSGNGVLELDSTTTSFTRFALTTGAVTTGPTAYRAAVAGGISDVMWLDDKHFIMLLNAAAGFTLYGTTNTPGALSVQVCRFDDTTNSMSSSGTPKALGTTAHRENFGNLLHKIDENNIAVIGCYQVATPSTHTALGVQILSI